MRGGLSMKKNDQTFKWITRSKSNLSRAKAGKVSSDILFEDLCFDAQQAVEKLLKALCVAHDILFPNTHNIGYLLELLTEGNVVVPDEVNKSKILTDYAVKTRYPGEYEPITDEEYMKAVAIAEYVYNWALGILRSMNVIQET